MRRRWGVADCDWQMAREYVKVQAGYSSKCYLPARSLMLEAYGTELATRFSVLFNAL